MSLNIRKIINKIRINLGPELPLSLNVQKYPFFKELCICRDVLLLNCVPAGTCCYGIVYLPGCVVTELCTCRDVLLLNCVPAGMYCY